MKPVILCVDDESIILKTLKCQLKDLYGNQLRYELAESGEEAMSVIEALSTEEEKVLVIVSDWMMQGMSGATFLRKVHKQFPGIGLIILTGQADDAAIENAKRESGVQHCIRKPWRQEQLSDAVDSVLAKINSDD